eukprot:TRINITY_DN5617_c0_g2_i1.p1 TRINITY_DN5617_c0_g2~~TRINITY_DN5617_c0_g2_i1.p1  ORF type:complete len:753 (+),score=134.51 TRINITY_DN5617_c0_g2_i1:50-2308(+)
MLRTGEDLCLPGSLPEAEGLCQDQTDERHVMPPASSGLMVNEIEGLRCWMEERLQYQDSLLLRIGDMLAARAGEQLSSSRYRRSATDSLRKSSHSNGHTEDASPLANMHQDKDFARTPLDSELHRQATVASSWTTWSNAEYDEKEFWQARLLDLFDLVDLDGSGALHVNELKAIFQEVGIAGGDVMQFLQEEEGLRDREIDREEWVRIVGRASLPDRQKDFNTLTAFATKVFEAGSVKELASRTRVIRRRFLIPYDSTFRMAWDIMIMIVLLYLCISLPFEIGFQQIPELQALDVVVDIMLLVDIVLNFFTSYLENDCMVTSSSKVAMHYLRTWFLFDAVASIPWDLLSARVLPNLQPLKLLKLGKITKVIKLLRVGKLLLRCTDPTFIDAFEGSFSFRGYQNLKKVILLLSITILLCHWLACSLAAIDGEAIDSYLGAGKELPSRYLASLYWAMTTLTTVGYGDVTPVSDGGRAFAMVAMAAGGAFYGYILGSITSVVSDLDVESRGYNERMEHLEAWLARHELPTVLNRRLRHHFKKHLRVKGVVDDSSIIQDMSRDLRSQAAFLIVHERVRTNVMFRGMPNSALATIVDVLKKTGAYIHETVVNRGDPGVAMFVIAEGDAYVTEGRLWRWPAGEALLTRSGTSLTKLHAGCSFGEEIIFQLAQTYGYSIVAATTLDLYEIPEESFEDKFRHMPSLRKAMLANFIQGRADMEKTHSEEAEKAIKEKKDDIPLQKAKTSYMYRAAGTFGET